DTIIFNSFGSSTDGFNAALNVDADGSDVRVNTQNLTLGSISGTATVSTGDIHIVASTIELNGNGTDPFAINTTAGNTLATGGHVILDGLVTLGADVTITTADTNTSGSAVDLSDATVNDSSAGGHTLGIDAGTATVTLANVGTGGALKSLSVT